MLNVTMIIVSKVTGSLHKHCKNERRVTNWDTKVRRDAI